MAESHTVRVDAVDGRFKMRRVLDLLAQMGLRACVSCGVWKSTDRFEPLTYDKAGTVERDIVCRACRDNPVPVQAVSAGLRESGR